MQMLPNSKTHLRNMRESRRVFGLAGDREYNVETRQMAEYKSIEF